MQKLPFGLSLLVFLSCFLSVLAAAQTTTAGKPALVRLPQKLDATTEEALKHAAIEVLHYYGNNTYLLSAFPEHIKGAIAGSVAKARPENLTAEFAEDGAGLLQLDLVAVHPDVISHLQPYLDSIGFLTDARQVEGGVTLRGKVAPAQLASLLAHPLVRNATPILEEVIPYNIEGRIAQTVTPLNAGIPGAPDLNGQGVVIGIGDGGQLSVHPDIGDRVLFSTTYYNPAWGNHPDMVAGIVAGAGNINSRHRGVACEADLIIEPSSRITYMAPTYLSQYQMSLTNNSYGPSFHCNTANKYYGSSASIDQQLFDNPSLLHVYAVGNSGLSSCNGLPTSYSSIPGGAQNAKNALSVGNLRFDRTRFIGSSAGPTLDGRLKPEIMAIGHTVTSNNRSASYSTGTGTSYAAPGVVGTLGLLTERYSALHSGSLPSGALLKAVVCNTAEDVGPQGPDFQHGFGLINGVHALAALENGEYHEGLLGPAQQYSHTLNVPAGTEQVKVLLYWPEPAGSTSNTEPTLVNDFDLRLVTPAGDTLLPWVLDAANPTQLAVRGRDSLNNIEQVTIDSPTPGNYTVIVYGRNLPLGTTDFALSCMNVQPEVMLTCPFGGEALAPGEATYIAWNASPGQSGTWKVEYKTNGGAWQTIESSIAAQQRHITWTPTQAQAELEFRVINEATGLADQTDAPVQLLGSPGSLSSSAFCNGDIQLSWPHVSGAQAYEVYRFNGTGMEVIASTTDSTIVLTSLNVGTDSLFSVAAVSPSGKTGPRAYATQKLSEIGGENCYAPLPVEWVDVQAEKEDEATIQISWTVASELNNERFEIQRRWPDSEWETIGSTTGRGSAPDAKTYLWRDTDFLIGGSTYYRIRQIDFDGSDAFSPIVVHNDQQSLIGNLLNVQENPVGNTLKVSTETNSSAMLAVINLAGQQVASFNLQPGNNHIPWPEALGNGMFILRLATPGASQSTRIFKQ